VAHPGHQIAQTRARLRRQRIARVSTSTAPGPPTRRSPPPLTVGGWGLGLPRVGRVGPSFRLSDRTNGGPRTALGPVWGPTKTRRRRGSGLTEPDKVRCVERMTGIEPALSAWEMPPRRLLRLVHARSVTTSDRRLPMLGARSGHAAYRCSITAHPLTLLCLSNGRRSCR
jgi:hypothetical protein